jgi:hypothetical protein
MAQLAPSQKGALAEAAIAAAVIELGFAVLRPLCDGGRYDLVIDVAGTLRRVQCKFARRSGGGGSLTVPLRANRCTPAGYTSTCYSRHEVDAVAAYSPELRRCFLLPPRRSPGAAPCSSDWIVRATTRPSTSGGRRSTSWTRACCTRGPREPCRQLHFLA